MRHVRMMALYSLFILLCACTKQLPFQEEMDGVKEWTFVVDTVVEKEQLIVTMNITNEEERNNSIEFPSAQRYEIELISEDGEIVYRYSNERMFLTAITVLKFTPHETKTLQESISLQHIDKGTYTVFVRLPIMSVNNDPSFPKEIFQQRKMIIVS